MRIRLGFPRSTLANTIYRHTATTPNLFMPTEGKAGRSDFSPHVRRIPDARSAQFDSSSSDSEFVKAIEDLLQRFMSRWSRPAREPRPHRGTASCQSVRRSSAMLSIPSPFAAIASRTVLILRIEDILHAVRTTMCIATGASRSTTATC